MNLPLPFASLPLRLAACLGLAFVVNAASAETAAPYNRNAARKNYVRPTTVPQPADNVMTPARVELGKMLFFDPRLSGSGMISCATCHNPSFAWGDALPKGIGHGHKELGRRTPTVLNTAFAELLFWDGRASSLEEQALGPIASPGEMNMPVGDAVARVRSAVGYKDHFEKAYPGEGITEKTLAKAIAAYERTIISGPAPFDAWIAGDEAAISERAKRGFDLFNTTAKCASCHSGWAFTDSSFHDIGLKSTDAGRGKILPEVVALMHTFKTPTLRNVDQRAPYMHDGSEHTLQAVVALYNRGGDVRRPSLSNDIRPLKLTQAELDDLCDFMLTLTSKDTPVTLPVLPR